MKLSRSADVTVGQTIFSEHLSQPSTFFKFMITPVLAVGLSLICVLPLSNSTLDLKASPAAYISIDLVPSIEASIDQNNRILHVSTLNPEARRVVPDPAVFEQMHLEQFGAALFERLNRLGYLNKDSFCLITTAITGGLSDQQRQVFSETLFRSFMGQSSDMIRKSGTQYRWIRSTLANREAAHERQLSAGKYFLYLQANVYGKILSIDEARRSSAKKIKEIDALPTVPWSQIQRFTGEREHHNLNRESDARYPIFQIPNRSVQQIERSDQTSSRSFSGEGRLTIRLVQPSISA